MHVYNSFCYCCSHQRLAMHKERTCRKKPTKVLNVTNLSCASRHPETWAAVALRRCHNNEQRLHAARKDVKRRGGREPCISCACVCVERIVIRSVCQVSSHFELWNWMVGSRCWRICGRKKRLPWDHRKVRTGENGNGTPLFSAQGKN